MIQILLFLLFFVMLSLDTLGMNLSLAPGVSVKNGFLYLIFLGIAIQAAFTRNRDLELLSVWVPYGIAIFYGIVSWLMLVMFDLYPRYEAFGSLVRLKGTFADHIVVFLVFFYGVLSVQGITGLLKAMIWTVALSSVITVIDVFNIPDLGVIPERLDGRVGGPIGESNQYAAFLALFLPVMLGLAIVEKGFLRLLAWVGFAASVLAFLMTASRGGFVGILVGLAAGGFFLRNYVPPRAVLTAFGGMFVLGVVAVAILSVAGYGGLLYDRVFGASTAGGAYEVSSGRTLIWMTALETMFRSPMSLFIGFGYNSYNEFSEFVLAPHNTYLRIFFELGLVGLILVLFTFANVLIAARNGLRHASPEASVLLSSFVFGLISILTAIFFVDIASPWLFIWAFAGAAMRLAVICFRMREENRKSISDAQYRRRGTTAKFA